VERGRHIAKENDYQLIDCEFENLKGVPLERPLFTEYHGEDKFMGRRSKH
jgi:hypothetical protein